MATNTIPFTLTGTQSKPLSISLDKNQYVVIEYIMANMTGQGALMIEGIHGLAIMRLPYEGTAQSYISQQVKLVLSQGGTTKLMFSLDKPAGAGSFVISGYMVTM